MAVESFTVGDLLNRLAFFIEGANAADSTLRPNYLAGLQAGLNDLVYECDMHTFETRGTLSLSVSGGEDYDLPDDFDHFTSPYMTYTSNPQERIVKVIGEEFDRKSMEHAYGTTKGKPRIFTERGTNIDSGATASGSSGAQEIIVHPTPDATYAVGFWYFGKPANFESDTNGSTIVDKRFPEQFKYAIIHAAITEFLVRFIKADEVRMHEHKLEKWKRKIRLWNQGKGRGLTHRRERSMEPGIDRVRPGDRWQNASITPWHTPS